jgi:hypothetical protein
MLRRSSRRIGTTAFGQPDTWDAVPEIAQDNEILFACYDTPSYEGYAIVLFERDGKLYEVHGSHCSCYGLEDQWEPEETTWPALAMRVTGKDSYYHNYNFYDAPDANEVLRRLVAKYTVLG